MKFAASALALAGLLSAARAETCSGFESRLTALSAQVQAMIDIVEAMQPSPMSTCGGLIGGKVYKVELLTTYWTDGTGPTDYSAYVFDSEWCCQMCRDYMGTGAPCTWWSLQYSLTKQRCQIFRDWTDAEKDADIAAEIAAEGSSTMAGNWEPGFLFVQGLGVGEGTRTSGRVPESGMWGSSGDGKGNYMYDTNADGVTYEWVGTQHAINAGASMPTGVQAEGFELCDSLGPFKPAWGNSDDANVDVEVSWIRHPLECCSLCVRDTYLNGNSRTEPCALWSYNYKPNKRECYTRSANFDALTALTMDITTTTGREEFQNAGVCAQYDLGGNPRTTPNMTPCTASFGPHVWSSGIPYASDLATIYAGL